MAHGLGMRSTGLLKPKTQTWFEALFLERRYVASLGFHEVRDRPLFPMYVDHRDRLIRLASEPAELVMNFASPGAPGRRSSGFTARTSRCP